MFYLLFRLMKYRVETVCHTAFSIMKNKIENIQPNIPVRASTSPVITTSAEKFTAVFPVCPHAFYLSVGFEHPVRTLYMTYATFSLNIRNPSLRIFTAALQSLSIRFPHCGQSYVLTCNGSFC